MREGKRGDILRGGEHRDGMQCNLGAKDKATAVHVATVLRTPPGSTAAWRAVPRPNLAAYPGRPWNPLFLFVKRGTADASDDIIIPATQESF